VLYRYTTAFAMNLDKLALVKFAYGDFVFKLKSIFANIPIASKNAPLFNSGQKDSKIIISLH